MKRPRKKPGIGGSFVVPPPPPGCMVFPWPPSIWELYFRGRTLTAKGRAYQNTIVGTCLERGYPKVPGRVAIFVECFPPDNWKPRDICNIEKPLVDAMVLAKVMDDDRFVSDFRVVRCGCDEATKGTVRVYMTPSSEFVEPRT